MRILKFDSVGGASGDMILAALLDLGVDPQWLEQQLAALALEPFGIEVRNVESRGLHGRQVAVRLHEIHTHGHEGRRFVDIREMIVGSGLSGGVKERCLEVFARLAEAEGAVHGIRPEDVHFHEIGALDSIIDIVGACLALESLEVDGVAVGWLPLGTGTVECRHGIYPVPAPATMELLKGWPVIETSEPFELVTPTGAALLMSWKTLDAVPDGCRIARVGHGFGHHELKSRPNLLRAVLLESDGTPADECLVLESNIDDTTPELLGSLVERLLAAGALDVFTVPVQMKKQRPGTLLTVLCLREKRDVLLDLIFRESTTFGVREYSAGRTKLDRRIEEVQTPHGAVRVKIGTWRGEDVTWAPEMDDCIRRADEQGVSVRQVYEAAARAARG